MNDYIEIRCKGCGRLLGKFVGKGEIKCPRCDCRGTNVFDTVTGEFKFMPRPKHTNLGLRKTSSGVTFR